jgi:hypothetical protein
MCWHLLTGNSYGVAPTTRILNSTIIHREWVDGSSTLHPHTTEPPLTLITPPVM